MLIAASTLVPLNGVTAASGGRGAGDYSFELMHNGAKRIYHVHVPPSYVDRVPVALVINFHGGGGSAEGHRAAAMMDQFADKHGFIVVYPEGTGKRIGFKEIGRTWNAGRCCGPAMEGNIDDVGFVRKMLDRLAADFSIDASRVYATGHSNGAQMAYRLACELSDRIAAIAPVASVGVLDDCAPKRPVPVIHFHGTADTSALYDGGQCGGGYEEFVKKTIGIDTTGIKRSTWECMSVPDYIDTWRRSQHCPDAPRTIYERGDAQCMRYGRCDQNSEVVLCRLDGAGHTWPGGEYGYRCSTRKRGRVCRLYQQQVGPISKDISANEMMWKFFQRHRLQ